MEIDTILNNAPELWALMGVIIGTVVLAVAGIGMSALVGTKTLETLKVLWAEIKGQRAVLYGMIDEGSDPINQAIAKATPFNDTPAQWAALFSEAFKAGMQYAPPPQEVNVSMPEVTIKE